MCDTADDDQHRTVDTACRPSPDGEREAAEATRRPAPDEPQPTDTPEGARARRLLWNLGFCGHFLHFHSGGRSGKAAIICMIAKNGGEMSQQQLGSFFELKPGSPSEILAKIEGMGLIERTRNPEDRRQLSVRLTEKGAQEAAQEQRRRDDFRNAAFSCLSEEEQVSLMGMLDKIRTHWEELDD